MVLAVLTSGCASKGVDADRAASAPAPQEWSNVEKLPVGTAVRVTERDGDKFYGRIMTVTDLRLTLELEAGSQSIARSEILLIERFPTSFPTSVPGAAVGVGAALSVASSSTRNLPTVRWPDPGDPGQSEHALRDVLRRRPRARRGDRERVKKAVERTRTTVVVIAPAEWRCLPRPDEVRGRSSISRPGSRAPSIRGATSRTS
jgi:hypothetical protein